MSLVSLVFSIWMASADSQLSLGLSLAHSGHYAEAEQALVAGKKIAPQDARFSRELAGVAYRRKDFDAARNHLNDALSISRDDPYSNNFLATLYFLDGNLEAAVKYWNRAGKPQLDEIRSSATLQTDPILLDRAFAFSSAELLTYDEYVTTRERLSMLGIFQNVRLELTPRIDQQFDLEFSGVERNGIGGNSLQTLISIFREAAESTVHFDFFNLGRSSTNVESLLRWNSHRQRASFSAAAPIGGAPSRRWGMRLDYRNEDWLLPPVSEPMTQRLFQVSMDVKALTRTHWMFSTGVALSRSSFPVPPASTDTSLFREGWSLKYTGALHRTLFRIPEKRAGLEFNGNVGIGRQLSLDDHFGTVQSSLVLEWYPHTKGSNHKSTIQFRAGALWGDAPFSEYFVLGREQDSTLLLRAHAPSFNDPMGETPIARSYVLGNFEVDQVLYKNALLEVLLTPFLDTGKAYDRSGPFGSRDWLLDSGIQWKLRFVRMLELNLSFGKNLRNGNGAFYFEISPL